MPLEWEQDDKGHTALVYEPVRVVVIYPPRGARGQTVYVEGVFTPDELREILKKANWG
mgnify:FL=1